MLWRSVPRADFAWREFDGEFVVRNGRTGNTHLLEPLAGAILAELADADGPLSVYDLAEHVADDSATEGDWISAVQAVLAEFQRLGLARGVD